MICRKCGSYFKAHISIDGRIRNLQRRKFCLDCSPFNSHNTRKKIGDNEEAIVEKGEYLRECSHHGLTIFITYQQVSGKVINSCKKCRSERVTKSRQNRKLKLIKFLGGRCVQCGYDKCQQALQFHHKKREDKKFGIGDGNTRSMEENLAEIKKCALLCANCHFEVENGITILNLG